MTTAAHVVALLDLDAKGFSAGAATAGGKMDMLSSKMKSVGAGMTKFGGAMTLGLTLPIVAFGASSVKSFMDAESAVADLEAVLKSTGNVAGVTLEELTAHASALQKITKFSDEAVMSAQGMLLTFTNIGKDIFPDATVAALNMAEKFGMDASQASITLGKALNDPIAGVGALRRIGVMLTDQQEEAVKQFMAVGDIASAQAIIMKELGVEIGGVAEAMGDTTAGKMEQLKNQFDDMKETVGAALLPVLIRLMEAITPLIERFTSASPQMQKTVLIFLAIAAAIGPVISVVGGLITGLGAIIPVVTAIAAVLSGPVLLVIGLVIGAIALLYLAWTNNFFGIRETATTVWEAIKLVFAAFKAAMSGDWTKFGELLRQAWDLVWALIEKRIAGAWTFIKQAAQNIVNGVRAAFTIDWSNLGRNIIDGIINGLRNGISAVIDMARSVAAAAADAIQGFLGIHSPSTLMFGFGQMTAKGFAQGMMANNGLQIPKALMGAETRISAPPQSVGAGGGQTINIHVENPKRETAEESIRKSLKSLSYTGVLAT